MPFQGNSFVRETDFVRDRDLGPPDDTISAEKHDLELDNVAAGLTVLRTATAGIEALLSGGIPNAYSKTEADERFLNAETALADLGAVAKAGSAMTGALTFGGKNGATKGVVAGGTVLFDYADGNVQSVTVNGPVTFDFKDLPALGGVLQINIAIQSGSITVAGTTWWELGGTEKSTVFSDTGASLMVGRPYRMIIEMVAGFRTGILQ